MPRQLSIHKGIATPPRRMRKEVLREEVETEIWVEHLFLRDARIGLGLNLHQPKLSELALSNRIPLTLPIHNRHHADGLLLSKSVSRCRHVRDVFIVGDFSGIGSKTVTTGMVNSGDGVAKAILRRSASMGLASVRSLCYCAKQCCFRSTLLGVAFVPDPKTGSDRDEGLCRGRRRCRRKPACFEFEGEGRLGKVRGVWADW
jgi:hypothetical protein